MPRFSGRNVWEEDGDEFNTAFGLPFSNTTFPPFESVPPDSVPEHSLRPLSDLPAIDRLTAGCTTPQVNKVQPSLNFGMPTPPSEGRQESLISPGVEYLADNVTILAHQHKPYDDDEFGGEDDGWLQEALAKTKKVEGELAQRR